MQAKPRFGLKRPFPGRSEAKDERREETLESARSVLAAAEANPGIGVGRYGKVGCSFVGE